MNSIPNPLKGERDSYDILLRQMYPVDYRCGESRIFIADYDVLTPRLRGIWDLPNCKKTDFVALFLWKTDFNDSLKLNGYCDFLISKKDESLLKKFNERSRSAEAARRNIENIGQLTQGLPLGIVNEGSRKGYVNRSSSIQELSRGVDDYLNILRWFGK